MTARPGRIAVANRLIFCLALTAALGLAVLALAQAPPAPPPSTAKGAGGTPATTDTGDIDLCHRLIAARRDYQVTLEQLRAHYMSTGDIERAHWAEDELKQFHRIAKQAYRLDLDVPPPTLRPNTNIPEANELYRKAMTYKDKGWNTDYTDNQRRAELLLQQILTSYPQCDKISDVAYQLGDIYESKGYKQYRRAARYFERAYEWTPHTQLDARLRAARIYDKYLMDRNKAAELYREVTTHETDPKRVQEATKRLQELSAPPAR
jgi:tetratricopeptide (TPR) repeat protein